jgi:hypothetical protein
MQVPKKEEDPRCCNVPVKVGNVYVGVALCDLGVAGNLMPYTTFKKNEGLELWACFMDIGLADGTLTKPQGMVRGNKINIDGFKFKIDVIVSEDNEG